MTSEDETPRSSLALRVIAILVGLALVAIFLSPRVRAQLNRIPNLWEIFYPALILFSGYLVVDSITGREGVVTIISWLLLFIAALSATAYTYGAPDFFLTVSRILAIIFIATEILTTALGALVANDEAEPS
jgi:hypothetical protein